jgi:hypothetical protein
MSILNLRAVADAIRIKLGLPPIEVSASVLSVALIHPKTGAVVAYIDDNGAFVTPSGSLGNVQVVTTSSPTTGGTVSFGTAKADELLNLTPAGTLAALTVAFPTNANSRIGQRLSVVSSHIITALTLSASGLTVNGLTPSSLAVNQVISYVKVAASTWQRTDGISNASGLPLTGPIITSGLTATGSASNDFSASTGTFKTSTGANTLGGVTIKGATVATPVAAAGSTTTDAAALVAKDIQTVSSDSAAKGVKLPTGVTGYDFLVINTSATNCKIYPATGGTINGGSADASVTLLASKGVRAVCTAADTWTLFDTPAKSA